MRHYTLRMRHYTTIVKCEVAATHLYDPTRDGVLPGPGQHKCREIVEDSGPAQTREVVRSNPSMGIARNHDSNLTWGQSKWRAAAVGLS